jgi:hypothetical protein
VTAGEAYVPEYLTGPPRGEARVSRRGAALLLLLVLGTGCGPATRYLYVNPAVTQAERDRDVAECADVSTVVLPSAATAGTYRRLDRYRFDRCMADRGYEIREEVPAGTRPQAP